MLICAKIKKYEQVIIFGILGHFIEIWQICKMANSWKLRFQPFSLFLTQPMTYLWFPKAHNIIHFVFYGPCWLFEWKMQKWSKLAKTPTFLDHVELRDKVLSMIFWSHLAHKAHKKKGNARAKELIQYAPHFGQIFQSCPPTDLRTNFHF